MPQPIAEQGRAGLSLPSPINSDWQHPDQDAPRTLYLLVYPPGRASLSPSWRDLHWSLAWHPTSTSTSASASLVQPSQSSSESGAVWRHVQVDTYDVKTDPSPQPRYVFWGTRTTSASADGADGAAPLALGTLSYAQRKRVEALAWETPVMAPDGEWNCQNWIRALLELMVGEGLVKGETVAEVVKKAETVHGNMPGRR